MIDNTEYAALFKSPLGARIFKELQVLFYDRPSFDKDPYQTAYNEGKRAVLIFIHNQIATSQLPTKHQGDATYE